MHGVRVVITTGPLRQCEAEPTRDGDAGAVVTFLGVVRGDEDGGRIDGLEYTVYEPMAGRVLEQLAHEALERFGVIAVDVEHSRGFVPVGACSFRLLVAGAHRREALDAMDWFIEQMKLKAPIWKRAAPQPLAHPEPVATEGSNQ